MDRILTQEMKPLALVAAKDRSASEPSSARRPEEAVSFSAATLAPAAEPTSSKARKRQEQGKKLEDEHTLEKKPANPAAN